MDRPAGKVESGSRPHFRGRALFGPLPRSVAVVRCSRSPASESDQVCTHVSGAASSGQPPCAAIIDSQTTKTTERGGGARGYDGRKKISGRKRHLLVDSSGLVGGGCTWGEHRRSERSKASARESCRQAVQEMKNVWADRGYNGKEIGERMKERLGWT